MFNEKYNNKLEFFGVAHIVILIIFFIVTLAVLHFKDKFKNKTADKIFRYTLASVSLALELVYNIWVAVKGEYGIDMLPILGLCASVNILTVFALFFDKKNLMSVIYYWALTGAFFSLIFIDTTYGPIHFRYFHYFLVHFNFLLAGIYYLATDKMTLTKKKLYISCSIIFVYSLIMLMFDIGFDQNWFYMLESPVKEISDFFGRIWYTILWIITITLLMHGWHYLSVFLLRLPKKKDKKEKS